MSAARENHSSSSTCSSIDRPFGEGAFRWVAQGVYTSGLRNGESCVWKWFKSGTVYENDFYKYDILAVDKAIDIVSKFNDARIIDKPIQVNRAEVWTGTTANIKNRKYLVEPFISHWQKFNSNNGWAARGQGWDLVMQALSHFSYHASGGSLVLCDLQGGILKNGAVISDPVIMSRNRPYGVTDLGERGIINFFTAHTCNKFCKQEWTRPKYRGEFYDLRQSTTFEQLGQAAPHAPTLHDRAPMTDHQYGYSDDEGGY